MFQILKKEKIAENTFSLKIKAPEIARKAEPGQFVIMRLRETSKRVSMIIADHDKTSITIVIQVVGQSTTDISKLKKGDCILDIAGPIGKAIELKNYGNYGSVCLIGEGYGIAAIYTKAKALKNCDNRVVVMIGAKDKKGLYWEDKLKKVSHDLLIATEDGSKGIEGTVIDALKKYLYPRSRLQVLHIVSTPERMRTISEMTKSLVKTKVALNTIMMDGIGLCGGCRVKIGDDIRFACVDGPEFNGHEVDWDILLNRTGSNSKEDHKCRIKK